MIRIDLRHSVPTLAVIAGLLAAAAPASADLTGTAETVAVTMLDYMGSP
jgi:hypothetical protein